MSPRKRQRAANFTPKEEEILVTLVKNYKDIIECKVSNTVNNYEKCKTWEKITEEFNASSDIPRDANTLKAKYGNIKKSAKKKFADEKCYQRGTGGGPAFPKTTFTRTDEDIKEMLGTQITGLVSHFDNDNLEKDSERDNNATSTLYEKKITKTPFAEIKKNDFEPNISSEKIKVLESFRILPCSSKPEELLDDIQRDTSSPDPASYEITNERVRSNNKTESTLDQTEDRTANTFNCTKLRTLKNKKLVVQKPKIINNNSIISNISSWASRKSEMASAQNELNIKEHQMKIQFMQDEHELKIKNIKEMHELDLTIKKEEWFIKRQFLMKENELKLAILQRQLE